MMNFADLERAHLTLAFLKQIPDALDMQITYLRTSEKIKVAVKVEAGNKKRRYTFSASSDDDAYVFVNDLTPSDYLVIEALPY